MFPGGNVSLDPMEAQLFFRLLSQYGGDAFGRLRVSEPTIEADVKFTTDLNTLRYGTKVVGTGAVAHLGSDPRAGLSVAAAGDRALIRSFEHFRYRAAQGQLINMTTFLGAPIAGVEKRFGYYSDTDGIYLAQTGTGLVLRIRSSVSGVVVDRSIPQASWNLDRLDGTGPSKYVLDPTNTTFVTSFDLQFLGHGAVRLGFRLDGELLYAHEEQHSNVQEAPYMKSGSQPLSWEIVALPGYAGGLQSMKATCGSVVREGATQEPGGSGSADTGVTARAVPVAGGAGEVFMLLRRKAGFPHAALRVLSYSIVNTGNSVCRVRLVKNPVIGGAAPVWTDPQTGFYGEVSVTAGMTATGGVPLDADYIPAGAATGRGQNIERDVTRTYALWGDLNGNSDVVAIVINQAGGATNALAALRWEALY